MHKIQNLEIPISPLNIQQQIINKINLLNDQSSHYNVYEHLSDANSAQDNNHYKI
jgi:restriction endonuclease S subunit